MKLLAYTLCGVAFTVAGCTRAERTAESADETTAAVRAEEAAQLENRLADVEREWRELKGRLEKESAAATADIRTRIDDDVAAAREAIAELRTTTAENWWDREQRHAERAANELESDVRRFVRDFKAADDADAVATGGDAADWRARRDELVARMEARIRAAEEALRNIDDKKVDDEETRARVRDLREDTDRLRDTSEAEWWDVTKERINAYIDRIDRAIDRLAEQRG